MKCPFCTHVSEHPVLFAEHVNTHRRTKVSITRDRVKSKPTDPTFRRGDYVIRAADWINKTGVSPESVAKLVCDIEPDPSGREHGWHVGVEGGGVQFHHECEFCLLEEIDDHEPWEVSNDFVSWIRINPPQS